MAEIDDILARIHARVETEETEVGLKGMTLRFLQIKDMPGYIERLVADSPAGQVNLPYWAKIWEAAVVLADTLLGLPQLAAGSEPRRVIELGAGMGLPGLFLAAAGHDVTLTDLDPEALEFARANALINGLDGVKVRRLDWLAPDVHERFEAVIGSELLYNEKVAEHLMRLLHSLPEPGCPIFLARGPAVPPGKFIPKLAERFRLEERVRVIRAEGESYRVSIYTLREELPEGIAGKRC